MDTNKRQTSMLMDRSSWHADDITHPVASTTAPLMPACLAKTRRAPSRHGRDAGVYGPKTTAMHERRTPPLPLSPDGGRLPNGKRHGTSTTGSTLNLSHRILSGGRRWWRRRRWMLEICHDVSPFPSPGWHSTKAKSGSEAGRRDDITSVSWCERKRCCCRAHRRRCSTE